MPCDYTCFFDTSVSRGILRIEADYPPAEAGFLKDHGITGIRQLHIGVQLPYFFNLVKKVVVKEC